MILSGIWVYLKRKGMQGSVNMVNGDKLIVTVRTGEKCLQKILSLTEVEAAKFDIIFQVFATMIAEIEK